ncbi:hypothetical protein N8I77_011312 [Diaporthe amygdali]|uniref:Uncharacterized protein n=1 Tax=Phomopsis amygdali TaxID=1214568 RepID=A0AAD9VYI5_PHOAM|nr:hypothetical protein N8I77_011312 [Diaporthe amygdali]
MISSVSSFQSFLSDDSYLEKLKPVDVGFAEMLTEIRAIDTNRSILVERKLQSHTQKRRDQADLSPREDWTSRQTSEYQAYKDMVKSLAAANKKAVASSNIAKVQDDEASCRKALADQQARSTAAIRAAEARLGFMTRYPNAYSTPSHANHIKAVEDNLNSAKLAQREVKDLLKSKH